MQQFLLDNLGRAIDRLIERCTLLDKDRTTLAHALARVQQELLREHASRVELEQRCRRLEARQEEAALRLEKLVAAMPQIDENTAEESRAEPDAAPGGTVRSEDPGGDAQESRDGVLPAQSAVKPFDIGSLERITRLAAESSKGRNAKPAAAEGEASPEKAALDSAAGLQDRLF